MRIKNVEELVGVTRKNIRFYEKEGLLSPGRNSENSYRDYSMDDVNRLKEIKLLRKLDMPISEIRDVLEGELSLHAALARHMSELESRMTNLSYAKNMCSVILSGGAAFSPVDIERYLDQMEQEEKEGILFVDIEGRDIGKKYVGPVVACVCVILVMVALIWLLLWAQGQDPMPLGIIIGIIAIPVITILGTIASLISRINEIRKGEENDLSKY